MVCQLGYFRKLFSINWFFLSVEQYVSLSHVLVDIPRVEWSANNCCIQYIGATWDRININDVFIGFEGSIKISGGSTV